MKQRTRKLVRPRDQWQILGVFVLTAGMSVLLNSAISAWSLANLTAELPNDSGLVRGQLPGLIANNAWMTLALVVPLFLLIGLTTVFRVFGPIHRFHLFLKGVEDGTQSEPCRLRDRDCLQDLCDQVNRVTEPLRHPTAAAPAGREREAA